MQLWLFPSNKITSGLSVTENIETVIMTNTYLLFLFVFFTKSLDEKINIACLYAKYKLQPLTFA